LLDFFWRSLGIDFLKIRDDLFDREAGPAVYEPWGRNYRGNMFLHVRVAQAGAEAELLGAIRREMRAFDPKLPVLQATTMSAFHDRSIELWAVQSGGRLFLVFGLGYWPRRDAFFRVLAITIAYSLVIGAIDAATGANYLYLRSKPAGGSLLDLLGPWPWYIASAAAIAIALLFILDAPFRLLRGWIPNRGRGARS